MTIFNPAVLLGDFDFKWNSIFSAAKQITTTDPSLNQQLRDRGLRQNTLREPLHPRVALEHRAAWSAVLELAKEWKTPLSEKQVSVSHCSAYVWSVVADINIGCDLENRHRVTHPKLAEKILRHENLGMSMDPLVIWSLKEAALKCLRLPADHLGNYRVLQFGPSSMLSHVSGAKLEVRWAQDQNWIWALAWIKGLR